MLKRIPLRNRHQLLTIFPAHFQCISGMVSRLTATRAGMWSCESYSKQLTKLQDYFAHTTRSIQAGTLAEPVSGRSPSVRFTLPRQMKPAALVTCLQLVSLNLRDASTYFARKGTGL